MHLLLFWHRLEHGRGLVRRGRSLRAEAIVAIHPLALAYIILQGLHLSSGPKLIAGKLGKHAQSK